jgi:hypothetical protein
MGTESGAHPRVLDDARGFRLFGRDFILVLGFSRHPRSVRTGVQFRGCFMVVLTNLSTRRFRCGCFSLLDMGGSGLCFEVP